MMFRWNPDETQDRGGATKSSRNRTENNRQSRAERREKKDTARYNEEKRKEFNNDHKRQLPLPKRPPWWSKKSK